MIRMVSLEFQLPADLGKIGGVWLGGQIANEIAQKLGVKKTSITASKM